MIRKTHFFYILFLLFLIPSCSNNNYIESFSDYDIVYQSTTLSEDHKVDGFQVGFVNADGSNNYLFKIPRNERWDVTPFLEPTTIVWPIITSDGKTLIFRNPAAAEHGADLIVYSIGNKAIECSGDKFGLFDSSRPFLIDSKDALLLNYNSFNYPLCIFKIEDCGTGTLPPPLISSLSSQVTITHGSITSDGTKVAYAKGIEWKISHIMIYDLESGDEEFLAPGIEPVWSPNDIFIAFIGAQGIFIADLDGNIELLVPYKNPERGGVDATEGDWPPIVSWSPDSQWITYHKCTLLISKNTRCREVEDFSIYKFNISTGEEILIIEGGLNPYWKK